MSNIVIYASLMVPVLIILRLGVPAIWDAWKEKKKINKIMELGRKRLEERRKKRNE